MTMLPDFGLTAMLKSAPIRFLITCPLIALIAAGLPASVLAQSVHCQGTISAWSADASLRSFMASHTCDCSDGLNRHPVCTPNAGGGSFGKHKKPSAAGSFQAMVAGAMFQSILTSVFADTSVANEQEILAAQKKAAEIAWKKAQQKKAEEAKAQAEYDKMMLSYKQLEGAGEVAFKTLSDSNLGLKGLEDLEGLSASARQPFDTPSDMKEPGFAGSSGGTPFFGDTMPIEDVRFLVNPENDPNVVDLRQANSFVVESLKNEKQKPAAAAGDQEKKPATTAKKDIDCGRLSNKLHDLLNQRDRFHKTIVLAQSELTTWQNANRNALMNAAKDGIDYFIGRLLDYLTRKGEAADRLMRILDANSAKMAKDGIDVGQAAAKIRRLKALSDVGRIAEFTSNVKDWNKFIKDGISAMIAELSHSNREVKQMLEDPMMQSYFETEAPALNALLDISNIAAANKVFGKWVAKQVPIIAAVELGINQLYNATDYLMSYHHIREAHKINGKVLQTAREIQQNMDRTYYDLRGCK